MVQRFAPARTRGLLRLRQAKAKRERGLSERPKGASSAAASPQRGALSLKWPRVRAGANRWTKEPYPLNANEGGHMQVELLYHTPDPERAVATAARLCYAPVGASELMESLSEERIHKVLTTILGSGHLSTLEHASYTFAIDGVSRALTHQLVRHRLASFNQQSQRYVKFADGLDVIKPETISSNEEASRLFDEMVEKTIETYQAFLDAGVPAEDARYILPNAAETKIVVTMNIRELLHFFNLRCCNRAQWEIRELAWRMLELVKPTAPFIFMDAGPSCVRGACAEGKMTCGNPYPRVKRD